MRKSINTLASLAIGAALGGMLAYAALASQPVAVATPAPAPAYDQPWCPTEDSCTADYDGVTDRWVITEVTP